MFKHFLTVLRADHARAEEAFEERNALVILEQQLRDAARAVTTARRAVALATAQATQERTTLERLKDRLRDLEARAVAAIERGEEALAAEAAETIATLEAERDGSQVALDRFEAEVQRLRSSVRASEAKLRELQRGQRLAGATERTQRLRDSVADSPRALASLADAEATLDRLRSRQERDDIAAAAMADMDETARADSLAQRMAYAGCGTPIRNSASAVLDRLREKAGAPGVVKPGVIKPSVVKPA